ncbi:MAG TPA: hypothetical protein P5287_07580 [bacterium]|nr:hypothetical protein [bacterium]
MRRVKQLIVILLLPFAMFQLNGCALLAAPAALLSLLVSLPMALIGGLFSLVGPATSVASAAAPLALLMVKNDVPGENAPVAVAKSGKSYDVKDLRGEQVAIDKVVMAQIEADPEIASVIFVDLSEKSQWRKMFESMDILRKSGRKTTCLLFRKDRCTIDQPAIDRASGRMEKKGVTFYLSRA